MAIDLARFHQAFFEESFERADTMEQALLQLDVQAGNSEVINDIFRAAHSIKGGAATFGFAEVAEFTHHLETLLDSVRAGQRAVDAGLVELLLRAADHVRSLLVAAKDAGETDADVTSQLQIALQQALENPGQAAATTSTVIGAAAADAQPVVKRAEGWHIAFKPAADLFRSGNDPLRILRELAELGTLQSTLCLIEEAPAFDEIDPESCYLAWDMSLESTASEVDVRDLFAWVEDECDLAIEPQRALAVVTEPVAETATESRIPEPQSAQGNESAKVVPITPAAPAAPSAAATRAAAPGKTVASLESSIRVATSKIDGLINLVGELVITQASLSQAAQGLDPLAHERLLTAVQELEHTTRRLQESVMSTRMLPIDAVFSRFPRMVHDLAARLGKQVKLQTIGEGTELDKGVIEKIGDPLTHLVRNGIDHGIESPEARVAAGKAAQGTLTLKAAHEAGQILIEIVDDGNGLSRSRILEKARSNGLVVADNASDAEVWGLIFSP
jgi:two-component system chemotaxis sensor kinase CheA